VEVESREKGTPPASAPFLIETIRITDNTVFEMDTPQALVADAEGPNLSLSELRARVARIADLYRRHGYPLARAIIPAQIIRDG